MGLDVSVVSTSKDMNLEELHAVASAVESGFYWYLGDDKSKRLEKWRELKAKCESLTRIDVLKNISGPADLVACISQMSDEDFSRHMEIVTKSICDHADGNTHLCLDYDKFPGESLFDSRSWNVRRLFMDCQRSGVVIHPCGDFMCELDKDKVVAMAQRWRKMSFKMKVARWVGYFSERVGFNILIDCLKELGVEDACWDFREAEWYKSKIVEVGEVAKDADRRLWLSSSY